MHDALRREFAVFGFDHIEYFDEGASAWVYTATTRDTRKVAIKLFKKPYDRVWEQRIVREAAILRRLEHENIVRIISDSVMSTSEGFAIAMEYIEGRSFEFGRGAFSSDERGLGEFLYKIATGLQYLHEHGIIHRDIHSKNVLLRNGKLGSPVLVDFALARDFSLTELQTHEEYKTFRPIGAMSHCAPEKWERPRDAGPPSDIFSIGVMMFKFLTGEPPYWAESYVGLYREISSGRHKRLDNLRPDLSQAMVRLIEDMINPDLLRRLSTTERLQRRVAGLVIDSETKERHA